jgi:4'-phosphopantetheinyl transferase
VELFWLEQGTNDVPIDNDWLSRDECVRCELMLIPKRRSDWRLGRWTAKLLLANLSGVALDASTLAGIEVRPAESGVPEAHMSDRRTNLAISLSHSNGVALCLVGPSGAKIGCDLEKIEPRSQAFVGNFFRDEEQEMVDAAVPSDRPLLANLIWSAKESALKALGVGLRADTRSVGVSFDSELASIDVAGLTWLPFHVRSDAGQSFQGFWRRGDALLRTVIVGEPIPQSLNLCPIGMCQKYAGALPSRHVAIHG